MQGSIGGATGLILPSVLPHQAFSAAMREFALQAAPARVHLVPDPFPDTPTWSYNGQTPGPEIRVKQGERVRITVENGLEEDTTVHWHGVRVPNAMDGVPHLTQRPIGRGERFVYEFDALDAGTFWYHPHQRSAVQVGRGLHGPLIIEEADPPRVDRDVTWVLDDWRLTPAAEVSGDFENMHDVSHGGRIGNTVTINGRVPEDFPVRSGERIRLRLVNAANARIFGLEFREHAPKVIALDGQPVEPHLAAGGMVVLGPAMRADLILDMTSPPETRVSVIDRFYGGRPYRLVDLAFSNAPLREETPDWPVRLPANPLPEPDVRTAQRHDILFSGGMMGRMVASEMGVSIGESGGRDMMGMGGGMMGMMDGEGVWLVNGKAAKGHLLDPVLTLARNRSHVVTMTNATAFHHPIHLHGHSFRVISRNGEDTARREWQDTVLIAPRERVEIAFVADNPGDWMFHCHILEHQAGGMSSVVRVSE